VIGGAAAVALVADHPIEESRRGLLVDDVFFFRVGDCLIQCPQAKKLVIARRAATTWSSDLACSGVARLKTKKCHWIASLRSP
jgi:hypothetical protein